MDSDNHAVCPFKGNTPPNRSFVYYPNTESWSCFHSGCGGGNVIHLYQHLNGIPNYNEATRKIAIQYGIPFGKIDIKNIKMGKKIQNMFNSFMKKCHNNPEFQNKFKLIEAKKRGFSEDTIKASKIGLFDDSIKNYMEKKYSNELLQNAGFKDYSIKDKEKKGKLYWKWGKRIVYPYFDQNDYPKYFIYRLIDDEPDFNPNAKYMKQIKTEYVKEIPFGLNSIYALKKKTLIITEGLTDSISVIQANFPVLSPITVRIKKEQIEKMINYCKRFKEVIVINDNEEFKKNKDGELKNTGLKGSIDTLKVLINHGINCSIGIIPNPEKLEKIDLDDYLKPDLTNINDKDINTAIEKSLEKLEGKLNIIIEKSLKGIDFLIDTINEKSTQKELIEIIDILPDNDYLTQEDVFKKLAKKRKITLGAIRKIHAQHQNDKLLKEQKRERIETKKEKESEKEDTDDIFERISLDDYDIEIRKNGIFKIVWRKTTKGELYSIETEILKGKLEILFKTYDIILDIDLYTFLLNGIQYNTYSIMNMIKKFEDKIYEGGHGRDIIKKVFNHFSDKIETRKPELIIGFNKGWKLPQREKEGGYAIICYTTIDRIVYKNAMKCIKNYTKEEKQEIIENLKTFIDTTQTPDLKLLKIIAWSIASAFRMPIINFFKIFPILYNYGERTAGKGSLEEFWIVHFYGFHKKLLPSKTLESPSRLEDYLASSGFPVVVTEAKKHNIRNTLSIIKEHASDNTDFERKKPDQTLAFRKTKTAGLCLDSNYIIEDFNDPALNSKCVMNEFVKKDIPKVDFKWKKLFRKLKKKKLFSFVYDSTKDWDQKTIFDIFDKIIKETKEKLENYDEIERINPRILSIFQVYLFGLYIWNLSFGFSLEEFLKINFDQFLESLISGRKIIPSNLVDQFYRFCLTAIDFDEGYINDYGKSVKGDNPKYITCKLKQNKNDTHYAFTQDNLRDFKEYINIKYNLKELANKLEDGLDDKEDVVHKNCYPFSNKKEKVILIDKEWLK